MKKRAQMEILGLVIIVILVSLGILFAVKFVVLKKPSTVRQSYVDVQLASNELNTLLKTVVDCDGRKLSVTDLLKNCAEQSNLYCIDDPDTGPLGVCEFTNLTASKYIFDKTLKVWGVRYHFKTILKESLFNVEKLPEIDNGDCNENMAGPVKTFTVFTDNGYLEAELKICT